MESTSTVEVKTPRTYTVTDGENSRSYVGFNKAYRPSEMNRVVVVLQEGSPDVYVLDEGKQAEQEFMRYLADEDENSGVPTVIVGIYTRQ